MYNVGESITYKIKVKNNSNNDYYFTKESFNLNTDYIEYSLINDSEVIKSNEEKEIELKITYKKQIPNDGFNETNMMSITLSDTPLSNPSTKRTLILIFLVIFITLVVLSINRNKKLNKVLIGMLICSIPLSIKALCTVNLEINANITINHKEAIFLPGQEVNVKMKELTGDDTSTSRLPYYFQDENITAIKYSSTEPIESEKQEKNIASTIDSPYPIYMWYEEGTIYWWSEAHHPKLNQDASYMFSDLKNLIDIEGLKYYDSSNTTNMKSLFYYVLSLKNINELANWDTSKVTDLSYAFNKMEQITSLEPLRNWNTSNVANIASTFCYTGITNLSGLENWDTTNVTDMSGTFLHATSLENLEPLRNWNTSNVTTLFLTFGNAGITNLSGLENWNTSNVTNMGATFSHNENLASLEPLRNWDTSSVTDMTSAFYLCKRVTSLEPLKNWNTSNVTNMNQLFSTTDLKTLEGLENWDVSSVTNMVFMISDNQNMTDASAINNWNIQPTTNFKNMFCNVPTHPEFSKVPGTWDSNGTFTPDP